MSISSARRYAQAVFDIALEKDDLEEWRFGVNKLVETTQDYELTALVESPRLPFESKTKLIKEKLGEVNPLVLNLAYLLMSKDRLKIINQIGTEYEKLLDDYHGIKHAEVTTAVPLNDTDKESLGRHLETMFEKKVRISLQVDPDIVGGLIVKIDDSLIDGSIRNKLIMLRKSLGEAKR